MNDPTGRFRPRRRRGAGTLPLGAWPPKASASCGATPAAPTSTPPAACWPRRPGAAEAPARLTARLLRADEPGALAEAASACGPAASWPFPPKRCTAWAPTPWMRPRWPASSRPRRGPRSTRSSSTSRTRGGHAGGRHGRPSILAAGRTFLAGPVHPRAPQTVRLPDLVTAGLPSVGVRVPGHALAAPCSTPPASRWPRPAPTRSDRSAPPPRRTWPKASANAWTYPRRRALPRRESSPRCCRLVSEPAVILRPGGVAREDLESALGHRSRCARLRRRARCLRASSSATTRRALPSPPGRPGAPRPGGGRVGLLLSAASLRPRLCGPGGARSRRPPRVGGGAPVRCPPAPGRPRPRQARGRASARGRARPRHPRPLASRRGPYLTPSVSRCLSFGMTTSDPRPPLRPGSPSGKPRPRRARR